MWPLRFVPAVLLAAAITAPVESLDWKVQRRVQEGRTPALDRVMKTATDLGNPETVMATLLACVVFGGTPGAAFAREAVIVLVPVNAAVEVVKVTFDRQRPEGRHRRSNASFPSSHAANAAGLAYVLARRRRRLAPLLWAVAAAVAWSRVYLNRHFLSDVFVGFLIGVGLAWLVLRWLARRDASARAPSESGPARNS